MNFSLAIDRASNPFITDEIEQNLQILWNRRRGEKFCTIDGKLVKMNLPRRIAYACSSQYRNLVQNGVRNAIRNLTDNIDSINLNNDSPISKEQLITDLFFQKLAPLSTKVYTRTLKEFVFNQLRPSAVGSIEEMEKTVSQEYSESYQEARLWAKLGNITSMGGASGSYRITQGLVIRGNGVAIIKDVKHLGIFKPSHEEPLAASNTRTCQKIKRWLLRVPILSKPFRGSMLRTVGGQAYVAEAATKVVERYVIDAAKNYLSSNPNGIDPRLHGKDWLKLVTDTQVATIDIRGKGERVGSFQLWVQEEHADASLFFGVNELYQNGSRSAWKRAFGSFLPIMKKSQPSIEFLKQKLPDELFDLLVIMDFVTGNGDRHADNWFVVHSDDAEKRAEGIRLIDGGQSMAPKHPTKWAYQELHNRYLWRNLALSREEFTPLGTYIIDELNKRELHLCQDVHRLYTIHQPNETGTTFDRLECMKDRIKIMAYCAEQKMTKAQLARIRTERDVARVKGVMPVEVRI
jgi:hypothetical protein